MNFDFDRPVLRKGTGCKKWDLLGTLFGEEDLLALWIADTEFPAPLPVLEALHRRVDHGVFGYPVRGRSVREAVAAWERTRHGWDVDPDWVCHAPGVMPGVAVALEVLTRPGDGVVVQPPVYPPFPAVVEANGRKLLWNPLVRREDRYVMDLEGLEGLLAGGARAVLLCSPHNPVGRVWTREELSALAELCGRYDALILCDEIHQDIVFSDGGVHVPLASLGKEVARRTVTFVAPSKTFNLAGFYTSAVVISDPELRRAYETRLGALFLGGANQLGLVALETAYREGAPWLDALVRYLEENRNVLEAYLRDRLPGVRMDHPEGTFVFWLDFRDWEEDPEKLQAFLVREARVALNDGATFGPGGAGFARINVGCPRAMLLEGLERIREAAVRRGWVRP